VETGRILGTAKKRTRAEHGPQDIVVRTIDVAREALAKQAGVQRVGIGVAGQLDRERGVVLNAPNLANMTNVKLAQVVGEKLGMPVSLFNDVEAAAAGEASFGTGRGRDDFVVVFVGTGIGGSVYQGGRPYAGATHTAGELGHMVVHFDGRLCGCGGVGHLEAYASRTAIVRSILSGLHAGRESCLREIASEINPNDPGGSGIRSKALANAVAADDPLTKEVLLRAADYLAAGLGSVINFYNPPLIILGGGLIDAVDLFFRAVEDRTRYAALQVPRKHVEIVKAALGDNSGIVGAAVLATGRL
jgi:glucokinase